MAPFMPHVDYGYSLVATAPSPASSGTSLIVTAGQGTNFPDPALVGTYIVEVWPAGSLQTWANAEQVLVTAKSTDTLTITRAQGTTSARTIVVGDQISLPCVAKVIKDIEAALDNSSCDFRLTLTSGTPVTTSDVTGATTIYCTPNGKGNRIALYNTTYSAWLWDTSAEFSIALGTLVNAQAYDLFCYDNAGTPTLEIDEWANGTITMTIASPTVVTWTGHGLPERGSITFTTTGALPTGLSANTQYFISVIDANTFHIYSSLANYAAGTAVNATGSQSGTHTGHQPQALFVSGTYAKSRPMQNGVYVKSTNGTTVDASRRYLGSFLMTSTTTTEDSAAKRFLYSHYNRARRSLQALEATGSWTYTLAALRQANGSASNQVAVLIGVPEVPLTLSVAVGAANSGASGTAGLAVGIGENSTSVCDANVIGRTNNNPAANTLIEVTAFMTKTPSLGLHYYTWLEASTASGTTTWYGTGASPSNQSGLQGSTEA